MIEALLTLLFLALVAVAYWVKTRYTRALVLRDLATVLQASTPAPVVRESADPPPAALPARDMVDIELVTDRGRSLGRVRIPRTTRRPTLLWTQRNGTRATFVCDRQQDTTFIYRRVGVEREN